jgi:SAM-dependent methyltransferase
VFKNAHDSQLAGAIRNPDAKRAVWTPVVEKALALLGGYQITFTQKTPIWLDVGCGDGSLLMTAADFGFNALGLDTRAETVSQIQQLGFKAHKGEFTNIQIEGKPDVLSMMDVLEHMPYPREALKKAASILGSGGLIIISLPDLTCSSWRLMDRSNANPYWMEIEHHHNFSRQRLILLLKECGFLIVNFAIPFRYKSQMEIYATKV